MYDVETVPLRELRPHQGNARLGNTDLLTESLRVHGQFKPIVVAQDNVIIAGNHTYFAAAELQMQELQCVRLPFPSTDARATKIMLVDNRATDASRYLHHDLMSLLESLDDDLLGTGYSQDSVDDLLALLQEQDEKPLKIDDDNTVRLPNLEEKLQRYKDIGRRMIVLDYSQEEYPQITEQLQRLRTRYEVPSNAQAVQRLLDENVIT